MRPRAAPMADLVTEADVLRAVSRQCELAGGQAAWAGLRGVSRTQLCEALSGRRGVTEAIANAAGFVRVTRFVRMGGKSNAEG